MYLRGSIRQLPTRAGDYVAPKAGALRSHGVTGTGTSLVRARAAMPIVRPSLYGRLPLSGVEGQEAPRAWDLRGGLSGLGQTDEQVLAWRDQLMGLINGAQDALRPVASLPAAAPIRQRIDNAIRSFQAGMDAFYQQGNNKAAGQHFAAGMQHIIGGRGIPSVQHLANELARRHGAGPGGGGRPPGGESGGGTLMDRFIEFVAGTGIVPEPGGGPGSIVRSSGWLLPVGAAVGLFFLLRR